MTDTQLAGALAVLTALGDLYRVSLGLSLAVVIAAFDLAAGVASSLRWLVTSYVITRNVQDQFTNFGASGALVFGLLTWLLLTMLLREKEPEPTR